ncbi:hypothetical protein [Psychrobacter sp. ASPA161_9]|uniref:hypothetical protein n=1 Tax=Psychrobacter sp. ASPA161_9 TaxID=3160961 RepID=UPI003F7D0C38
MNFNTGTRNISFIVAFALLAGCASIDTNPFQQFNSSLIELNKGATSSLDVTIPLSEERYIKEIESELKQGNDNLFNQLLIETDDSKPFLVSESPTFLTMKKFKLGVSKVNLAWVEYSNLLLELSSNELVDDEKFLKLATDLNANARDAVQSLKYKPNDTTAKYTGLFSTSFITGAEEYINTKQKEKLIESLTKNQDYIGAYVKDIQEAIHAMAQSNNEEFAIKQESLGRDLLSLVKSNENGNNDVKIRRTLGEMIDIKTAHLNQVESLQALYIAYGRIPAAHAALATRLSKSDSSIAAINDLLEKGIQLHSSYEATAKVNKVELVKVKADAANSKATTAEIIYQQGKLKYAQAQFEYTLAKNALNTDPSNNTKKKDAEYKKKIADELKLEVDTLKESSEALRVAATAIEESASEVIKSIIKN